MSSPPLTIPFNRPTHTRLVDSYVAQALQSGHLSGDGEFTRRCHDLLGELLGGSSVLLTTSGTHALELIALLLDIGPGDEVIVPSFTFPSTANAFVLRGAIPVFIDIRRDTLNLDESHARIPDHQPDARNYSRPLRRGCLRDGRSPRGRRLDMGYPSWRTTHTACLGSIEVSCSARFGVMAAQSFHETKNFSAGEGGAIVINDPKYIERAEIIREKGTNRRNFFRGLGRQVHMGRCGIKLSAVRFARSPAACATRGSRNGYGNAGAPYGTATRTDSQPGLRPTTSSAVRAGTLRDALPSLPHGDAIELNREMH